MIYPFIQRQDSTNFEYVQTDDCQMKFENNQTIGQPSCPSIGDQSKNGLPNLSQAGRQPGHPPINIVRETLSQNSITTPVALDGPDLNKKDHSEIEEEKRKLPLKLRLKKFSEQTLPTISISQTSFPLANSTKPEAATVEGSSLFHEEFQVFASQHESHPKVIEEKDAFVIPLPYQQTAWIEVVKLAHSIMTVFNHDPHGVQNRVKEIKNALKSLSREDVRKGELETLDQACGKGESAIKFWNHLNSLKQNIQANLPFHKLYRMEYFDFSNTRQYVLSSLANPEAETTIRLYRKKKEDGRYHYELLILQSTGTPARRQTV